MRIDIDADGTIARITPDSPHDGTALLTGPVLPGMPNVHSHAFQRALAGRAERATGERDSFWTWRTAMYDLAARVNPDDLAAIAAQLYVDLLEGGYTAVAEFHYLHHDRDGAPFATRSEMAQRLLAAADAAGIGITLLPVFYRWSGFGRTPALHEQRRFVTDLASFAAIYDELAPLCATPNRALGIAPHSLRAVAPDELRELLAMLDARDRGAPVHLHVAEQSAEVDACIAYTARRPVEWLLEHVELSRRWCLIHATHVNAAEIADLAPTGAVAGICPTTEANLGDGIFPLEAWLAHGGATAIGSDSHVCVEAAEELRWLEYAQRLRTRRRSIAASPEHTYIGAAQAGARALARPVGTLGAGLRADFVVLDGDDPALAGGDRATLVDRYVVAGGRRSIREVYVGGRRVVAGGVHRDRAAIAARYRTAVERLFAR